MVAITETDMGGVVWPRIYPDKARNGMAISSVTSLIGAPIRLIIVSILKRFSPCSAFVKSCEMLEEKPAARIRIVSVPDSMRKRL